MGRKNLIFIHPLSQSLRDLRKVQEDLNENELFDVDLLSEAHQLIPVACPALILGSDLKKTAKIIVEFEHIIKTTRSKFLLLSNTTVDNKIINSLRGRGLTDYIDAPIALKSLTHKVGLLLRTVPNNVSETKEEDPGNSLLTIKSTEVDEVIINQNEKLRVEKTIAAEDMIPNFDSSTLKEVTDLNLFKDDEKDKKKAHATDSLDFTSEPEKKAKHSMSPIAFDMEDDKKKKRQSTSLDLFSDEETNKKKGPDKLELVDDKTGKKEVLEESTEIDHSDFIKSELEKLDILSDSYNKRKFGQKIDIDNGNTDDNELKSGLDIEKDTKKKESMKFDIEEENIAKKNHSLSDINIDSPLKKTNDKLTLNDNETKDLSLDSGLNIEEENEAESTSLDMLFGDKKKKKGITSDLNILDLGLHKKKNSPEDLDADLEAKNKDKNLDLDTEDPSKKVSSPFDVNDDLNEESAKLKSKKQEAKERQSIEKMDLEEDGKNKKEKENKQGQTTVSTSEKLSLNIDGNDDDNELQRLNLEKEKEKRDREKLDVINAHQKKEKEKEEDEGQKKEKKKQEKLELVQDATLKSKHDDDDLSFLDDSDLKKKTQSPPNEREGVERHARKKELDNSLSSNNEDTLIYGKKKKYSNGIEINLYKKEDLQFAPPSIKAKAEEDILLKDINFAKIQNDDEISGKVRNSKSMGLDFVIDLLKLLQTPGIDFQIPISFMANAVKLKHRGVCNFFMFSAEEEFIVPIYSGHEKEYQEKEWQETITLNKSRWEATSLPTWSDHTFQEDKQEFIYPYYEGIKLLGYSIVYFDHKVHEESALIVENLLSSLRCLYLENYHAYSKNVEYQALQKKKEAESGIVPKVIGFIKSIFSFW